MPERGVTRCDCQLKARGGALVSSARIPKRYEHCELSNFTADFPGADHSVALAQISATRFVQEFDPRDGRGVLVSATARGRAAFAAAPYAVGAREILGKYIVQAAKNGERDQQQLCEGALLQLAKSDLTRGRNRSQRPGSPE